MKMIDRIDCLIVVSMMIACATTARAATDDSASAPPVVVKLLPGPFEFPVGIGKLLIAGQPHKYDDPRAGISYQYGAPGMALTVYVYDAGIKDIPDGGNSKVVCEFAEAAKQDIHNTDTYKNIDLKSEQMIRLSDSSGEPMIRESVFEFDVNDAHRISYVWITGAAKQFVKMRFTVAAHLRDEIPDLRRAILSSAIAAVQPYVRVPDTKAEDKSENNGHSINIAMGGASMEDGIMYLMTLGVLADKIPENAPVCGGEFVPDFESEVGAYQGLLGLNSDGKSPLMKQLRKINEAGFLGEFVWEKLHRDQWGTSAPDSLKLAEFDVWQKKNLKRFERPYFGSITFNHPRPIPIVSLQ